jgi:uncharacterized membrane protein YbhN (UPF0104 family)
MKKLRLLASIAVLLITIAVFVRYIQTNPEVITQLKNTRFIYLIIVMALYLGVIISLTIVNTISVQLCGKKITKRESFNLTSTSSIANFFGPLQSGVGIRALYFKAKLAIPIKQYGLISLYYYGLYAFFSGIFLLFGSAEFRLPLLLALIIGACSTALYIHKKRSSPEGQKSNISAKLLIKLASTVLLQLAFITTIYYVELLALGKHVSFGQIVSYSGAANFSLFVAITPGAIGIREAFLVFSQNLHHISRDTVISANILDRGIYVVFLSVLFLWLIATHTQVKLKARQAKKQA